MVKDYYLFENTFLEILNIYPPVKKKFSRANPAPYMKAIMKRSEIKSKYSKNQTAHDFELYKKQRNYCSKLYKKRKRYYNNMNLTNLNDNRHFWKTVKPFLTDKGSSTSKNNLVNKDKVFSDDSTLVETFGRFFESDVKNLGISEEINTTRL